jgi:hypothetical protein
MLTLMELCRRCAPFMGCGYWIPELVALAGGQVRFCRCRFSLPVT